MSKPCPSRSLRMGLPRSQHSTRNDMPPQARPHVVANLGVRMRTCSRLGGSSSPTTSGTCAAEEGPSPLASWLLPRALWPPPEPLLQIKYNLTLLMRCSRCGWGRNGACCTKQPS